MNNPPLLTIAIPVYNGANLISKTLESIAQQIQHIPFGKIEILISDNASTDDIKSKVDKYLSVFGASLTYSRNSSNLGYDGNIAELSKRATGDYIWFFGCGEVMLPDALCRILESLADKSCDNLLLNFGIESEDNPGEIQPSGVSLLNDARFSTAEEFLKETGMAITPMSANIISREAWIHAAQRPLTTDDWAHVERIFCILANDAYKGGRFLSSPAFILLRDTNGWWTHDGLLYIYSLELRKSILGLYSLGVSDDVVSLLLNITYKSLLPAIVFSKSHGLEINRFTITLAVTTCWNKATFWIIHLPILLFMPKSICANVTCKRLFKFLRKYVHAIRHIHLKSSR